MRKGVGRMRRIAAILSVTVVALMATGTGAGAVTAPKLVNFPESVGKGQVLAINLQLPSVLSPVLSAAGLSNNIEQVISFSRSIGQADSAPQVLRAGSGLGQIMEGTLNPLLETIAGRTLPKVFATLGEALKTDSLLSQDIGVEGVADLIHIGVMEVSAVSKLADVADGLKAVISDSSARVLGLKVGLGSLAGQLTSVLQPVLDLTDKPGGLIDTINNGLQPVEDLVNDTLGTNLSLDLPKIAELLEQPLLSLGVIETESGTGLSGLARTARGVTRIANIDLLGSGDNALVHIDSLESVANVALGGAAPVANAVNKIIGLRVAGNQIDLTDSELIVGGRAFELPLLEVVKPLQELLGATLGLKIDVLGKTQEATATRAFAEANTLKIELAPLNGALGLVLGITGPASSALVRANGPTVQDVSFPPLPTTGVPTTAYFLAGPALLGLAIRVRKYSLSV